MPRLTVLAGLLTILSLSLLFLLSTLLDPPQTTENPPDPTNSVWVIESSAAVPAHDLYTLGQHFIIGLNDFDILKILVEHGAIGGIFISSDYAQAKTKDQLQLEIATLQTLQGMHDRPPLFIATDQEGGLVERLSPPLPKRSSLKSLVDTRSCSDLISSCFSLAERMQIEQYGKDQGSDLRSLGVTLNFAPVVDTYQHIAVPGDQSTRLSQRALSQHPWLVKAIAAHYVAGLNESRIIATLKHFPGLGSADGDTHVSDVSLTKTIAELGSFDLLPFQIDSLPAPNAIMLSHVKILALDPNYPASISQAVVTDLLRNKLSYAGLLLTDDFSMFPIQHSQQGQGESAVMALNSGVDLILFTGELDQYLDMLDTTLSHYRQDKIDKVLLSISQKRLNQARLWTHYNRSN